jgi:hypothetical protein
VAGARVPARDAVEALPAESVATNASVFPPIVSGAEVVK